MQFADTIPFCPYPILRCPNPGCPPDTLCEDPQTRDLVCNECSVVTENRLDWSSPSGTRVPWGPGCDLGATAVTAANIMRQPRTTVGTKQCKVAQHLTDQPGDVRRRRAIIAMIDSAGKDLCTKPFNITKAKEHLMSKFQEWPKTHTNQAIAVGLLYLASEISKVPEAKNHYESYLAMTPKKFGHLLEDLRAMAKLQEPPKDKQPTAVSFLLEIMDLVSPPDEPTMLRDGVGPIRKQCTRTGTTIPYSVKTEAQRSLAKIQQLSTYRLVHPMTLAAAWAVVVLLGKGNSMSEQQWRCLTDRIGVAKGIIEGHVNSLQATLRDAAALRRM